MGKRSRRRQGPLRRLLITLNTGEQLVMDCDVVPRWLSEAVDLAIDLPVDLEAPRWYWLEDRDIPCAVRATDAPN